jgi:acyl-CoA synthetase (AMP-forming)/AMP-acid ligase II
VRDGLKEFGKAPIEVVSDLRPYKGTIGDLARIGRRLAAGLFARGIRPGDVVAVQLPNWPEAIAAICGLIEFGAILVPIAHNYGHHEVSFILAQSKARALITAARFRRQDYLERVDELFDRSEDLELVAVVGLESGSRTPDRRIVAFESLLSDDEAIRGQEVQVDPDAPMLIGYTSGTTARPKGVIHSHRSYMGEIQQTAKWLSLESAVAHSPGGTLVSSPVGHMTGFLTAIVPLLSYGSPVTILDVWESRRVLALLEERRLSLATGATFFLANLLDDVEFAPERHIESLKQVALGGAPIPRDIQRRARDLGISLVRYYGSTEHLSTSGSLHSYPEEKRLETDGAPLPGVEIRIADEMGHEVPTGIEGEIQSRGPDLFVGYTDPTILDDAFAEGGWYMTGDIGYVDSDGFLTITDRKKDIIIRGGENISASEVEDVLSMVPGVAEIAVVAAPDSRMGEHCCAVIRMVPGASPVTLEMLQLASAAAGLAKQKWPESLVRVDDFPRTGAGKVQKHVLRDQIRSLQKEPS